ncbi:hypothetical protein HK100_003805 [Physocladia obscura]|uniref:Uncharacterized protein n=1 Tax=Physocladia obscura TaxID=109957 RepID=A0AAD5T6P1_9FUNG|nr:hypothetical protein HK100_003805 [Physocladia obscura]
MPYYKNNDARRTSSDVFLKRLANNLAEIDSWLPAANVHWFNTAQKHKPTQRAVYLFVLKRLVYRIDGVEFDPADPSHLDELSDPEVSKLLRKVLESKIVAERTTMDLILLSHSGLGMLSLDCEGSDRAVNAPGQRINIDCIGFQRLKNKYDSARLNNIIRSFRTIDFVEAAGALKSLMEGTINYKPKKFVPQSVKDAILAKARFKWDQQHFDKRKAYILNKNPAAKVSQMKDIRKWHRNEPKLLFEHLGFINPVTGHIIDPDDFVFDRITDDSEYVFDRVLPISIPLNDAKSSGTSTNAFSTMEDLSTLKKKRGWDSLDDRLAVVQLLHEFITALVNANSGFAVEE